MSNPHRSRLPLPQNVNVVGRRCVRIEIPDDPEHIAAFWGHFWGMTRWFAWHQDETRKAKAVADVWQEIFWEARERWESGECCPDEESECNDCHEYLPGSGIIEYSPSDPFVTPNYRPLPYAEHPWSIGSNPILESLTDILPSDVTSTLWNLASDLYGSAIRFLELWAGIEITNFLPRFKVRFEGSGEVELHLLKVPQGGLALITVDGNPLSSQIVDMESISTGDLNSWIELLDLIGIEEIVGRLFEEHIIEIPIETAGDHYIDVTFLPKLSIGQWFLPDVGWGGGLRKVVLCGANIAAKCPTREKPRTRINQEGIEWFNGANQQWERLLDRYLIQQVFCGQAGDCSDSDEDCEECEDMGCCITDLRFYGGKLQMFRCGEWEDVAGSLALKDIAPNLPEVAEGEPSVDDNAKWKAAALADTLLDFAANGGDEFTGQTEPEIVSAIKRAFSDLTFNEGDLALWVRTHKGIDEADLTYLDENLSAIRAALICALVYHFDKTPRLSSDDLQEFFDLELDTGNTAVDSLVEDARAAISDNAWRTAAYQYVASQPNVGVDCASGEVVVPEPGPDGAVDFFSYTAPGTYTGSDGKCTEVWNAHDVACSYQSPNDAQHQVTRRIYFNEKRLSNATAWKIFMNTTSKSDIIGNEGYVVKITMNYGCQQGLYDETHEFILFDQSTDIAPAGVMNVGLNSVSLANRDVTNCGTETEYLYLNYADVTFWVWMNNHTASCAFDKLYIAE